MATPRNYSVQKAFALLQAFHHAEEWLTCSELSRRARLPEASGYRLIQTLAEIGAVVRGPQGRYGAGMLLTSLSQNVAVDDCLSAAAQDIMEEMSRRLDVTAHLARLDGGMVSYVAKSSTPASCQVPTYPGAQLEAYSSALGKVLLSALPPGELNDFVAEGELVPLTPHTITDKSLLLVELDAVRRNGFARDDREFCTDISCVAVPVRDNEGRTMASLSATERPEKLSLQRQAQLQKALMDAARAVSRKVFPQLQAPLAAAR